LKQVYQYAENGVFLGTDQAQESPLEPGVFLLPRNSTLTAPPKIQEGFFLVWVEDAGKWEILPDVQLPADTESPVLDTSQGERVWRNSELARADIELNKAQDGDGVSTVKAWREYRKALRAYPNTEGFPNSELRPTAPDVV
jgi:hypothetical protein